MKMEVKQLDMYGDLKILYVVGRKALADIFPVIGEIELDEKRTSLKLDFGVGNPSTHHYSAEFPSKDGKRIFIINGRYHNTTPPTYRGEVSPCKKLYLSYKFLHEAGVAVPHVAFYPEIPQWLFTENIPGETLGQIIKKHQDRVINELHSLTKSLPYFHIRAGRSVDTLTNEEASRLFWSRSTMEQSRDFLEVLLGQRGDLDDITRLYLLIVNEAIDGDTVCHGDLSPDNIIKREGRGSYWYIDPELKLRNKFFDIGSLLGYLGCVQDDYSKLATSYLTGMIDARVQLEKDKLKEGVNESVVRESAFELSANMLHASLRIISKRKRRNEDSQSYEAQRTAISQILAAWESSPGEFLLNKEELERIKKFRDFYENQRENSIEDVCVSSNQNS